ncbi:ribonuclease T2 family protein [Klebsiella sp. BIGb0407]|uniref:ribonuclease T2 family protein n=1 Tax=Klebsiella sp. BIGb0407 TaxID=2940603 RepID=UPI0021681155|nr:ribonuclease I [Klebsiella sp. BIGb0407]MCS3432148.1 ribonuclease I [Klebsiella sp. BIGb0407]
MINIRGRYALLLILLFFISKPAQAEALEAGKYSDFSHYTLALSWRTGFCHQQHDSYKKESKYCKNQKKTADKGSYITVHGLWPSLPESIAARGVDEKRWILYGCATRPLPDMPEVNPSNKCNAPLTGISLEVASRLADVMPAAGGDSCLDRYEYAKHASCFGFNPNDYFDTMVRLSNEVKQQKLGHFIQQHYGKIVTREEFNRAVKESWGDNAVQAIKLNCHGNPAYLTDIHIALRADKINQPLHSTSFAPQKFQGNCSNSFRLDASGY